MNKNLVLDVEENPKRVSQWFIFAIQHILAMLVACITVPLITGLPVAATLIAAGMGTLIYIFCTNKKSPVFLSSSFAYLLPMQTGLCVGGLYNVLGHDALGNEIRQGFNYGALILGMALVGLVYVIVALIIKFVGTKWINKLLPPIVVGPIIMVIGLSLSGSAINNLVATGTGIAYNWPAIICGLTAMVVTALAAHYGKNRFISLIPFVLGMVSGYVLAVLFTVFGYHIGKQEFFNVVDFTPFVNIFGKDNFSFASIFNYKVFVPNDGESFLFLRFDALKQFNWANIGEIILLFVPVAFVTICEHIGDHENLGHIIGRDLLNGEPGMKRTLLGDGLATAASGALCGAANTTYGENVAVIGTTKIASVNVVLLAAVLAVVFGFVTPLTALLTTIPKCVTGGVSLILYGFIASSGVKMLMASKVDFNVPKNIFIASVILVSGIGGLVFKFYQPGHPDQAVITISNVAVAMILGIALNFILRDPKAEAVTENNEQEKAEETAPEPEVKEPVNEEPVIDEPKAEVEAKEE